MSSMFNKQTQFGGAFKANDMILNFAGFGAGYLITGVNAGYNVNITRLRELGSDLTYFVEGDHQGTLSFTRITGPSSSMNRLIAAYSDVCSISTNTISLDFAPGKCAWLAGGDAETGVSFNGVVFNQWGMESSVGNQMLVSTTLSGNFETLRTGPGSDATGSDTSYSLQGQASGAVQTGAGVVGATIGGAIGS